MNAAEFIESLDTDLSRVVVCAGEESFFKEEVLQAVDVALDKRYPGHPVSRFDVAQGEKEKAAGQRLVRELSTPVLFGGATLFVVRGGQKIFKEMADFLLPVFEGKRALANYVVFFVDSVDKRTKVAKRLGASGGLVECKKLYETAAHWQRGAPEDSELNQWACRRARAKGLEMDLKAAQFLTSLTGNDLFLLDGELDKLCLGLPEGETAVGVGEIEQATGMSAVHTPFDLWDKIEAHDGSGALETLGVILRNGLRSASGRLENDAAAISAILLGMFRERIRLSAQVAIMMWAKQPDEAIMKRLKIKSAFYLKKLKASGTRLTASSLKAINASLLAAERRIKRRGHVAYPVMEEVVIKLAS
jgi:DNA polymerase III delta subunit